MISPRDYQLLAIAIASMSSVMLISHFRLFGFIWLILIFTMLFTAWRILIAMKITRGRMQAGDWLMAIAPGIGLCFLIAVFSAWGF